MRAGRGAVDVGQVRAAVKKSKATGYGKKRMGLYNFQPQFVAAIEADRKRHTIRAKRRYPDRPGSVCHLFVGLRRKGARLLKRRRCVKVQEITITADHKVFIDGEYLGRDERGRLALSDGFKSFPEMMAYWTGKLPFCGQIVHWESDAEALARRTFSVAS